MSTSEKYPVTSIGEQAFAYNNLINITIPNSITDIQAGAFAINNLTNVEIPNSVTIVGDAAFAYNRLTNITIPNSVTSIGSSAFKDNQLTSVAIPNSVTEINNYAFEYNQLTSIIIPNSVTSIGSYAFNNNQLTSLSVANSETYIGDFAFADNNLTDIPSNIKKMGNGVFNHNLFPDEKAFIYKRNSDGTEDKTTIISYAGYNKTPVIESQVNAISSYAFADTYITGITMPEGLTKIGNRAFLYCDLDSVIIPSTITEIDGKAFWKYGGEAFWMYGGSNHNLTTIVNQTGKSFNWGNIINGTNGYNFETGTVENEVGNVEIVSELPSGT